MAYLMGIDLGTSSVKTLIMDEEGNIKALTSYDYKIQIPEKGYAEQDPEVWWKATVYTIRKALDQMGINPSEINGIGFSGQMHGLVPIDRENRVIRPAIVHVDQRSIRQVQTIYQSINKDDVGKITLNPLFPGFQLVSLLWLKENEPENYKNTAKVLSPKDFIRLKLINKTGTDYTDASATLAFDTVNRKWSEVIISKAGIDLEKFPELGEPSQIAGYISSAASLETGLKEGTPVVYGGADQPMQALGNGIIEPGTVTSTIGTSGIIYTPVSEPIYNPELNTHTFCNVLPNTWYTMGAILSAGLCLRWLKENILRAKDFESLSKVAGKVNAGSDGLIFLPYLVGERTPHLDSQARGLFFGLSLQHQQEHMVKAVMEGVGFALKDSIVLLEKLGIEVKKVIASGGGAKSKVWLQIQADIYGREIYTTKMVEQACTGAAVVAGVGSEVYSSIQEACQNLIKMSTNPVIPVSQNVTVYKEYFEIYKELYSNNHNLYKKL